VWKTDLFSDSLAVLEILVDVERRFIAVMLDEVEGTGRTVPMGVLRNNEPLATGFVD
jgi:hypothetical protein